jgi:hypothetical protein
MTSELERAGALRFQAERVSVPETREKFLKEAETIEKKAKVELKETIKEAKSSVKPASKPSKTSGILAKFDVIPKLGISGKATNRGIIRSAKRMEVEIHQKPMGLQKMDRDKSRFFTDTYKEEKRSLFFS